MMQRLDIHPLIAVGPFIFGSDRESAFTVIREILGNSPAADLGIIADEATLTHENLILGFNENGLDYCLIEYLQDEDAEPSPFKTLYLDLFYQVYLNQVPILSFAVEDAIAVLSKMDNNLLFGSYTINSIMHNICLSHMSEITEAYIFRHVNYRFFELSPYNSVGSINKNTNKEEVRQIFSTLGYDRFSPRNYGYLLYEAYETSCVMVGYLDSEKCDRVTFNYSDFLLKYYCHDRDPIILTINGVPLLGQPYSKALSYISSLDPLVRVEGGCIFSPSLGIDLFATGDWTPKDLDCPIAQVDVKFYPES